MQDASPVLVCPFRCTASNKMKTLRQLLVRSQGSINGTTLLSTCHTEPSCHIAVACGSSNANESRPVLSRNALLQSPTLGMERSYLLQSTWSDGSSFAPGQSKLFSDHFQSKVQSPQPQQKSPQSTLPTCCCAGSNTTSKCVLSASCP